MSASREINPCLEEPASFRDPSGFLFTRDGELFRQVNRVGRAAYDKLMGSGLYESLLRRGWLIPHLETDGPPADPGTAYRIIKPERVEFVAYPYEWCFSQLKDAAQLTLNIAQACLDHDMVLKDASAYNIQFHRGRPVLIDSLSFDLYREGAPWVAYRQFCQHFLAPLALMARRDVRLARLAALYIDGIPLDLAAALLPRRTALSLPLLAHLHLHAKSQKRYADKPAAARPGGVSRLAMRGLLDSLLGAVKRLNWRPRGTEWADYYQDTNYSDSAMAAKSEIVSAFLDKIRTRTVWDLGANTGYFSRLAAEKGAYVVSWDVDPAAVEKNYRQARQCREENVLPLLMDLTNPSPALGWAHRERMAFAQRGPADAVMALALVHHLAIGNNVPLPQVAEFFASLGRRLIVEFVPKEDSQAQRLLASREDIFSGYHREGFETAFCRHFRILSRLPVTGSRRWLYLMEAGGADRRTEEISDGEERSS